MNRQHKAVVKSIKRLLDEAEHDITSNGHSWAQSKPKITKVKLIIIPNYILPGSVFSSLNANIKTFA